MPLNTPSGLNRLTLDALADLYGIDILSQPDLDPNFGSIAGLACVLQNDMNRLMCKPGSNPFHPNAITMDVRDYLSAGLDFGDPTTLNNISTDVENVLLADTRKSAAQCLASYAQDQGPNQGTLTLAITQTLTIGVTFPYVLGVTQMSLAVIEGAPF